MLVSSTKEVHHTLKNEFHSLKALISQIPKELGYPWEVGNIEDHIRVDDGLGPPFVLPRDLCSSPMVS